MKACLTILFLAFCALLSAQPVPGTITPMQDYHFYSDADLKSGVNCMVLTNRKQMEKVFGKIDRPDTPDFSKEFLLVMVMPSTKKDAKLRFKGMSIKAGGFIEVYCEVHQKGHLLTYDHYPIAVATIPRKEHINTIHFFDEKRKHLISSVAISERL